MLNVTDIALCMNLAVDHFQLENPTPQEALYAFLVNPETAPLEGGFELLQGTEVTLEGDQATLTITALVSDMPALKAAAEAAYEGCWGGSVMDPRSSAEELLYELLVASNASPSPCDVGYEIVDMTPTTPQIEPEPDAVFGEYSPAP
jgi:hypothetical protein